MLTVPTFTQEDLAAAVDEVLDDAERPVLRGDDVDVVEEPPRSTVILCTRGVSARRATAKPEPKPSAQLGLFTEPCCRACGCTTERPCMDACALGPGDLCTACRHGKGRAA